MSDKFLTFNLVGHETEDGRTLVRSDDLTGFHFVIQPDEDPMEAMIPTLKTFMIQYIRADIKELAVADTPRHYVRKDKVNKMRFWPSKGLRMVAEVA